MWQNLKRQFELIPDFHNELSAERIYENGKPVSWRLTGATEQVRKEFEVIARKAGGDLYHWLDELAAMPGAHREPILKWESDDGKHRAMIPCGRIDQVIQRSIEHCSQAESETPTTENKKAQPSRKSPGPKGPWKTTIERRATIKLLAKDGIKDAKACNA